jgi:hypothetical protein
MIAVDVASALMFAVLGLVAVYGAAVCGAWWHWFSAAGCGALCAGYVVEIRKLTSPKKSRRRGNPDPGY